MKDPRFKHSISFNNASIYVVGYKEESTQQNCSCCPPQNYYGSEFQLECFESVEEAAKYVASFYGQYYGPKENKLNFNVLNLTEAQKDEFDLKLNELILKKEQSIKETEARRAIEKQLCEQELKNLKEMEERNILEVLKKKYEDNK